MKRHIIAALAALVLTAHPLSAQQETSRWTALAERDWADLPPAARDAPVPQDSGYLSREVKPGVFVVTEGLYQAMFVITRRGVVVVDAPPTIGRKLMTAIRAATDKPVTHFIYSHSHIDHVGAAAQFGNVMRIGSTETAAKLARLKDPNRPRVSKVVGKASNRLMIDGVEFRLDNHGTHHEPGNLYIQLPQSHVLMVVDIIYPGWVPFTNLGMAEDVQGFIDAHDTVLSYDFDVLVGGHLSRPGTRADAEVQRDYVRDLLASAQAGQRAVNFGSIAGEVGFANRWLLVKTYMDRVADHCAAGMIERWRTRLGGAAVSTPGHCWIMQEHLNINGAIDN
jgi:glyoxylase-like metal-dependent hydrolase (beta-lactamase superfamily II)